MILAATTDEIKKWVAVTANFEPANLVPAANEIKRFIIDILGEDEFNLLVANYPNTLTIEQEAIFPIVQKAMVNFAMWHYAGSGGQLEISQSGMHINTSDTRKTAFEWQIKQAMNGFKQTGGSALQDLLLFLWGSATGTYLLWRASDQKREHLKFFCNDAFSFSAGYGIKNNYTLFRELKDTISFVEMQYIIPVLQSSLAADIKAKIQNFSLSPIEIQLVEKINFALASMTIFHAIPKMANTFTELGIFDNFSSMNMTVNASNPARDTGLSLRLREAENVGQKYLVELGRFLITNATSFPLFTPPTESTTPINKIENGIYMAGL